MHNARVLHIEPEYIVIEKTGHKNETDALLKDLEVLGVYEFIRSGRVAITKPMEQLNAYLNDALYALCKQLMASCKTNERE